MFGLKPLLLLAVYFAQALSQNLTAWASASSTLISGTPAQSSAPSFTSSALTAPTSANDNPFTPLVLPTCILPQSQGNVSFPEPGSVPKDFSDAGLSRLWDIVGTVTPPPFTTTVTPTGPVTLPSSPPALYPSWFAPEPKDILPNLKLPEGFLMGVATAAYQVEGAVKNEGKGPSIWDWENRQHAGTADNTTADVVDLHYFLYKVDVDRVAALGLNAHSFSISWPRILPFGTADSPINQQGIDHYRDVINYHNQAGVAPVVTLFHWDTPLALQAYYGGFTSPSIVNDFIHYAKTVFTAYNGTVKTWYTFNEPVGACGQIAGYPFDVTFAPGVNASTAPYICSYHLLKAHAGAVKAFREMNIVGEIAFKSADYVPLPWRSNNTEDELASERHVAFNIAIFADPVYKTGDWPQLLKDTLPPEYLPRLTEEEKADIKGSADFFAIDAYRRQFVSEPLLPGGLSACVDNRTHPLWPTCHQVQLVDTNGWAAGWYGDPLTAWLQGTPVQLRDLMKEYYKRWPTNKIYLSEFGFTEPFEGLRTPRQLPILTEDVSRTNYFMTFLGQLLLSIHEDNLPIAGAFAWSMVDNIEWSAGVSARFGIQYVNYTSPTLDRVYKRSALALSEFFKSHKQ